MELPDLKKCHRFRLSIPDLILGLILDPPKCAEEGSRCSLSLVFTFLAFLKMTQKRTSKWTPLRPKISDRPLLGASRTIWGSHFCASELMLKNVSEMYRNDGRFGDLGAGCPTGEAPSKTIEDHRRPSKTIENPWNLHGISMESPSNLHGISIESPWSFHRIRSEQDPPINTRWSESAGL
jgi:hypothetical protein